MFIPSSIRAILFDAVGTLIYPEPSAAVVYAQIGQRFGSRRTAADIRLRFAAAFQREEDLDLAHDLRTSEARETERWRRIVAEVLDDVTDPDACFCALFEHFARPEAWRCNPDAAAVLPELARRGYMLGLASNYDARLRRVAAGLSELAALRHLCISSELGWRKPAVEFFAGACRMIEQVPENVLLVGDDRVNDYEGAQAAGLSAVLFDPKGRDGADPETCIRSLAELTGGP